MLADAKNSAKDFGVVINPDKFLPVTFAAGDKVVVVAED